VNDAAARDIDSFRRLTEVHRQGRRQDHERLFLLRVPVAPFRGDRLGLETERPERLSAGEDLCLVARPAKLEARHERVDRRLERVLKIVCSWPWVQGA
jgi:hypothetical protein